MKSRMKFSSKFFLIKQDTLLYYGHVGQIFTVRQPNALSSKVHWQSVYSVIYGEKLDLKKCMTERC